MNDNDKNKQNPGNKKNPIIPFLVISIVATVILNLVLTSLTSPKIDEIAYSEFVNMIDEDKVDEVILTSQKIEIFKTMVLRCQNKMDGIDMNAPC